MNNSEILDSLRYPIGKFAAQENYSSSEIDANIRIIESLPDKVASLVEKFSAKQWETSYREEGWTARQLVHHLCDSHLNAYIRIKWSLTEDTPVIKAYDEKRWAETPEVALDPSLSIMLLKAHHAKWAALLRLLAPEQLKRQFIHPDSKKHVSVERMIALYAWHSNHHFAHLNIIAGKG